MFLVTLNLHYQSVALAPLLHLHDKHKRNFSHTLRATPADALCPMEQSRTTVQRRAELIISGNYV